MFNLIFIIVNNFHNFNILGNNLIIYLNMILSNILLIFESGSLFYF